MRLLRQPPVWSPLDLRAILAGIRAAWLGGECEARRSLEDMLRDRYQPEALYLTDSGTSALTVALRAAWAHTRAPVALPAYCCYDVATAADGAGIPFLLYDVDPDTLSPDFESLRMAVAAGARSVVVAHLFGVPADLAKVEELTSEFGCVIIEDAAQGSGCAFQGRPAGAHGALGVLSFGRGKGVTGGSGGALLVNEDRLARAAETQWARVTSGRPIRGGPGALARITAQWLLGRPGWYAVPAAMPFLHLGETAYHAPHTVTGLSAFAAGVLTRTLRLVPDEIEARRERAAVLRRNGPSRLSRWVVPEGWDAGWLRYPVVLQDTAAEPLAGHLVQAGVARGYPGTLAELEGFGARRLNPESEFPGAEQLASRLVTIPTQHFVRGATIPAI